MFDGIYKVALTKRAAKDAKQIDRNELQRARVYEIIKVCRRDPYEPTPGHRFEKLSGPLEGKYSRRITVQHRFIYEVLPNDSGLMDEKTGICYDGIVRVYRMWGHGYKK